MRQEGSRKMNSKREAVRGEEERRRRGEEEECGGPTSSFLFCTLSAPAPPSLPSLCT